MLASVQKCYHFIQGQCHIDRLALCPILLFSCSQCGACLIRLVRCEHMATGSLLSWPDISTWCKMSRDSKIVREIQKCFLLLECGGFQWINWNYSNFLFIGRWLQRPAWFFELEQLFLSAHGQEKNGRDLRVVMVVNLKLKCELRSQTKQRIAKKSLLNCRDKKSPSCVVYLTQHFEIHASFYSFFVNLPLDLFHSLVKFDQNCLIDPLPFYDAVSLTKQLMRDFSRINIWLF